MERAQGDENTNAEETPSNSKKPENLDSPQFQEMVRSFRIEKELLEKQHKEEIEKLKENFSMKEGAISENQEEHANSRQSEFGHFSQSGSSMAGQSMETHIVRNGNR